MFKFSESLTTDGTFFIMRHVVGVMVRGESFWESEGLNYLTRKQESLFIEKYTSTFFMHHFHHACRQNTGGVVFCFHSPRLRSGTLLIPSALSSPSQCVFYAFCSQTLLLRLVCAAYFSLRGTLTRLAVVVVVHFNPFRLKKGTCCSPALASSSMRSPAVLRVHLPAYRDVFHPRVLLRNQPDRLCTKWILFSFSVFSNLKTLTSFTKSNIFSLLRVSSTPHAAADTVYDFLSFGLFKYIL